jgi:predicted  nucleic acid-binding Zn-ribbon protein
VLQSVAAKKQEAFLKMLEAAETEKKKLEQQVKQLEHDMDRAAQQMVERVQQAADKDEDAGRQLSLLRKVRPGHKSVSCGSSSAASHS